MGITTSASDINSSEVSSVWQCQCTDTGVSRSASKRGKKVEVLRHYVGFGHVVERRALKDVDRKKDIDPPVVGAFFWSSDFW